MACRRFRKLVLSTHISTAKYGGKHPTLNASRFLLTRRAVEAAAHFPPNHRPIPSRGEGCSEGSQRQWRPRLPSPAGRPRQGEQKVRGLRLQRRDNPRDHHQSRPGSLHGEEELPLPAYGSRESFALGLIRILPPLFFIRCLLLLWIKNHGYML